MILGGTLAGAPEPVSVNLVVDASRFSKAMAKAANFNSGHTATAYDDLNRYLVQTAQNMTTLDVLLEVIGLSVDQVWATFYVRGAMSPDFEATEFGQAARDQYLRSLLRIRGDRGRAAVTGFLAGWTQHRGAQLGPVEAFAWHRYMSGVEMKVSAA